MEAAATASHASCVELERHFQGCSHDLDAIAQTLEAGFDKSGLYRRNPAQMLLRLKALRDDLPKVQEDWRRIMTAKQNIIEAAKSIHLPTCRELKNICHATEVPTNGQGEEACITHFEQLSQQWDKENAAQIANSMHHARMLSSKDLEVEVLNSICYQRENPGDGTVEKEEKVETSAESGCNGPVGAAVEQPPKHAITEEEFKSVSNVVRGRCKFDECNMLLEQIISHQKKQNTKRQQAITTSDLAAIGARATGQTGASRLATLRSLKRITISKEGVLVNPKYMK